MEKGYLLYGRYRIDSVLGRGGMGSVYRAVDENLGIPVAVKENLFTTEEYARQFKREATILAGLRHSNLPRVTDHFVLPGQGQYLVMDYIEGDDLRSRIEKGNLPSERLTMDWARQICDALHYLHSRQPPVVHRDIKPGNIRITPDGRAVLVDFGLARLMEGPTTTTGAKAMTPGYSPPEQYGASRTDSRTDIYALAATLYTLLSGSMPEDGLERALGQKKLTPIRSRNPKISPGIAAAIEKSLEVLPENRFQTIDEFFTAINAALPSSPSPATTAIPGKKPPVVAPVPAPKKAPTPIAAKVLIPPRKKRGIPAGCLILAVFLLMLGAASIVLYTLRGEEIRAMVEPFLSSPTLNREIRTQTALALIPPTATSMAPTGNPIAITYTPVPTFTATTIPTPVGQSNMISYVSNKTGIPQIYLLNLVTNTETQITDQAEGACQPDWSPDGIQLIFTSPCKNQMIDGPYANTTIFKINIDGSGLTPLTKVPGGDFDPAWSPDGKSILVTSLQDGRQHIYRMEASGEDRVLLSMTGAIDSQPRWSPDGTRIVFLTQISNATAVFIMNADGSNRIEFSSVAGSALNPDWSINDFILYVVFNRGQVVTSRLDSRTTLLSLTPVYQATTIARFSPDGQWILFDMTVKKNRDIYLLPIVGAAQPRNITSDTSVETDPAWRPMPKDQ